MKKNYAIIGFILLSTTWTTLAMNPQPSNTVTQLTQIADEFEKSYFNRFPEIGLMLGKSGVDTDRFMDHSMKGILAWEKTEDDFIRQLEALNENDLIGTPQHLTYQMLKEKLIANKEVRLCKECMWNVNPRMGWHILLSMISDKQPIGSAAHRQAALKRWKTFDTVVNDEINNLKLGLKEGYTAPQPAVEGVIKQLKILLALPIEKSPYFDFARLDNDPHFKNQVKQLIEENINPSLKKYLQFLETQYLPKARREIGLSAIPQGEKCYQAQIRRNTTLNASPESIYEFGLQHMQELQKEVSAIGEKEFGIQGMTEIFRLAKAKTKNVFRTEQDILEYNQAALLRAKNTLPNWFAIFPKAESILKPYPIHQAKTGASGEYHPPSEDGSRPGIFYINTYEPENKNRMDLEATLFHELIPGHHFQVSLAMEDKSQHHLNQYLWNAGYGEGWALYVERLADEMGLYQDNMSRLGMLSNEALRTARLVIDPGIHLKHWTRQQAIDYLKQYTTFEDHIIESEIDRYIMIPGQATAYMLGKREIESLRSLAENKLQEKFNVKEFHTQVLKNGSVTLPMLREQIEKWLLSSV